MTDRSRLVTVVLVVSDLDRAVELYSTTGPIGDSLGVPVVSVCEQVERWDQVEICELLGPPGVSELCGDIGQRLVADPDRSHA